MHSILDRDGGHGFMGSAHQATLDELDACYRLIEAAPMLLQALYALHRSCASRAPSRQSDPLSDESHAAALRAAENLLADLLPDETHGAVRHAAASPRRSRPRRAALVTRHHLGLPFWTVTETVGGQRRGSCPFDVRPGDGEASWDAGVQAAAQAFAKLRSEAGDPLAGLWLYPLLKAVCDELGVPNWKQSKGRAAGGFMYVVRQMMISAAMHVDVERFCREHLDRQAQFLADRQARVAHENAATGARLRAAKAARAAARRVGATSQGVGK